MFERLSLTFKVCHRGAIAARRLTWGGVRGAPTLARSRSHKRLKTARVLSSDMIALWRAGGGFLDTSSENTRGLELEPGGLPTRGGTAGTAGITGA